MFPYGGNKGDQCTLQGEPESTSYSVVLCVFSVSPKTKVSGDFVGRQVVVGGKESKLLIMLKALHENTQDKMKWVDIKTDV